MGKVYLCDQETIFLWVCKYIFFGLVFSVFFRLYIFRRLLRERVQENFSF